ncbi:BPSL0761 family protein [Pseudomonas syringae]|uniref:BPSL0761 family protein n=1 Tax=Pseudomonas syringae TaxID=317 RepID=UPI00064753AD|nr:BPSL0761 family protein [Pseudomonas syringae]
MTMPSERTRSVIQTEAFLRELSKSPLIPEEYRNEAKRLLRHYPESSFVLFAGKMDDIIQGAEPGDPRRELAISGYHPMFTAEIKL